MQVTITSLEARTSPTKGDYAYGKGILTRTDGSQKPVMIMSCRPDFLAACKEA